jgi:hypothetical protein
MVYNEFIVPPSKYCDEFKMLSWKEKSTEIVTHECL